MRDTQHTILSARDLEKSFGERQVRAEGVLSIGRGEKLGFIGPNGAGKTTLLRMLVGELAPDRGEVNAHRDIAIGYLPQVPIFPDAEARVGEFVRSALQDEFDLNEAYQRAAAQGEDTSELQHRLSTLDAWNPDHKAQAMIERLGLKDEGALVGRLSGGEQKRTYLAWLLLKRWDLLVLDEPTNHLDPDTVEWLEDWLQGTESAFLVVTHDRYFLDRVVDTMLELRDGVLRRFKGAYSEYLVHKAKEEALRRSEVGRQLRFLRAELAWAKRAPSARGTKQKARLQRLEEAQQSLSARAQSLSMQALHFRAQGARSDLRVELVDLSVGYEGRPLLEGINVSATPGDRIGIVGANGTGKSTLLKTLLGVLGPITGRVVSSKKTKIAYFDQHRDILSLQSSLKENLCPDGGQYVFPPDRDEGVHISGWLKLFGFSPDRQHSRVSSLSGGERNRLALAKMMLEPANLLLLDEPTNDLDLETLSLLEEALQDYHGIVLMVSHDRYFLNRCANRILAVEPSGSTSMSEGDYDDYKRQVQRSKQIARSATSAPHPQPVDLPADAGMSSSRPTKRLTYAERLELESLEESIAALEDELAKLELRMEEAGFWAPEAREQAALAVARRESLQAEIAEKMDRWAELSERPR